MSTCPICKKRPSSNDPDDQCDLPGDGGINISGPVGPCHNCAEFFRGYWEEGIDWFWESVKEREAE